MDQSSRELSPSAGHYVLTYGVVVLLWLLLVGSLQPDGVFIGLIVGAIVTALMSPRLSIMAGVRLSPWAPFALVKFLIVFFVALIRSNVDMARRVLSPSLPIRPAVVEVRIEQEAVREAPPSMLAPMLALAGVLLMVGFLPNSILNWVAAMQAQLGLPVVDYYPGGFSDPRGDLNMIWIVSVLLAGLGLAALAVFGIRGRSKRVHAPGSLTGGHFPGAETRHGYVDSFYAGLMQLIGPWYCGPFAWLERALVSGVRFVSSSVNRLYRYVQPTVFLLATAVAVVAWAINAGGF